MAEATVSEQSQTYTVEDFKAASMNVSQAVAILRSVSVAADAVQDGAVTFEHDHVCRWGPAIAAATRRVALVRDVLVNRLNAPAADWYTSLTLLEALDATMWHGESCKGLPGWDTARLQDMCEAIASELDELKAGLALN